MICRGTTKYNEGERHHGLPLFFSAVIKQRYRAFYQALNPNEILMFFFLHLTPLFAILPVSPMTATQPPIFGQE
jgi:uncharacterized membrane protein YdjX (TVP38/TMEM64 family)